MRVCRFIVGVCLALVLAGCHKTGPQSPSQRSGDGQQVDSATLALMELNRRMSNEADKELIRVADSLHEATGVEFAQMGCGGWKSRRTDEQREKALYAHTPTHREKWRVRWRTLHLDGRLATDTESEYAIKRYKLPIAIEEALEGMYTGETVTVLAPWYCSFGIRGNEHIAPYENVIFEVTLGKCTYTPPFSSR